MTMMTCTIDTSVTQHRRKKPISIICETMNGRGSPNKETTISGTIILKTYSLRDISTIVLNTSKHPS